jgi:hypothetical protein
MDVGSAEVQQEADRSGHLKQTSPTPIRVVILILSAFREPWSSWQKDGQDQTFLRDIPDGVMALRYSGLAREKRPKFRTAIFLKRTQHALQKVGRIGSLPVLSRILRYLSRLRSGDTTIAEIKKSASPCESVKGPSTLSTIDVIFTPVPSNPELIGLSTIEAFSYVLENYDFQYIFRTNSSSYVNLQKLLRLTESLPKTGVYAGFEGRILRQTAFASGAGYLLSRDIVEAICLSPGLWRHGLIDDIALADFMSTSLKAQIAQIPLPRRTVDSLDDARTLSRREIQDHFHYRCKTGSTLETVEIMQEIHFLENTYKAEQR